MNLFITGTLPLPGLRSTPVGASEGPPDNVIKLRKMIKGLFCKIEK